MVYYLFMQWVKCQKKKNIYIINTLNGLEQWKNKKIPIPSWLAIRNYHIKCHEDKIQILKANIWVFKI